MMPKTEMKPNRVRFFRKRQSRYQADPVLFFREVLKFEPDPWQADVAADIASHRRVTVRSGQGVGKTGLEAAILLWFVACFPFSRVVATAPTRQQLNDVLWAEVAKWQARSPLLSVILKWTKTYIYMVGMEKRWFAVARTATKPENMQGFHEDNMLFIVDEASGVSEPIMEAVLGTLSGQNNKLLMCGNPTKTSGTFFESHNADRRLYRCHAVNSLDSPRTDKENIRANIDKYGEESNFVRVRVFGEFPLQEDDVFIPLSLIEASVKHVEPKERKMPESISIACDVARYGNDKTVIGKKVDERIAFHKKAQGQNLMRTAADIAALGEAHKTEHNYKGKIPVKVDDGGLGGGVVDRLREIKASDPARYAWMEIVPALFGHPIKHLYYHDTTTYMMSVLRDMLSAREVILPNDNDLIGQLSARKYHINERGKMVAESKDSMKKRGLPSPDEADCVLLLCLPVKMKEDRRDPRG
ncbi:MAG: DEAD/DEAH box helicase family protein [Oscillospiraceae bacterium]|jgi:hypothetical protein|nr:DEAD/DEAH box helicase family protein [Oscillospiraceae bacterium]